MTSYHSKNKIINPLYAPPSQHYRLFTSSVLSHFILLHRETLQHYPTLALSATAKQNFFPILQHIICIPSQYFAHGDTAFPDLVNFFLQT